LSLDLASFASVKSAADTVRSSTDRLDILINNAGVLTTSSEKTKEGHEVHFGINHVGHHLLTQKLLPILEKTAALPGSDVRVLTLSSVANERAPPIKTMLDMEELCTKGKWARYGASKAANILFAAELARRYPTLTSVSIHPGIIKSDIWNSVNENSAFTRFGLKLAGPFIFETIETGAHNTLWGAAAAKKDELRNGAYYTPVGKLGHANTGNKRAKDVQAGRVLWEWTEAEIEEVGT
jgi:NAD(P)-dependent dehydrogenase (short-subunit alcohol dehydrogenase family)